MINENGTLKVFCNHYRVKATMQWILYYWQRQFRIFKVNKLKLYYKGK